MIKFIAGRPINKNGSQLAEPFFVLNTRTSCINILISLKPGVFTWRPGSKYFNV